MLTRPKMKYPQRRVAQSEADIQEQIDFLGELITATRAAVLTFVQNGAQKRYRFDTGRQVIDVEREDLNTMRANIAAMMNERQILCQRIGQASGTLIVRSI